MAMTPVVGATDVYADDVDGNEGEQVAETKPQESVNLSGSAETSSSNEDSSDSSSSESITGKADVTTDVNGDITVEATVEATVEGETVDISVDIDETKQSDSSTVFNADGSKTETDTALSLGTDESTKGDTTTKTETKVETKIETTTAADFGDYDNVSSEETEGSTVVQTTVTSVSVAITTTETTITTSYDEKVTDPEVIAIIEAAIANPQVGQIREDKTGKYIKIGDAEYKYTQTTNTVPVDITSEDVLERINKELLKEDKVTHTDDNGNNYIKVEDTWYEYKTEAVDDSTESGKEVMDKLKSEAGKPVTNDDNSVVTETKVLTVDGKSYTYKVTTEVLEVTDENLLKQIKYYVEHENRNVEVKDGKTYVTIEGVTYTYSSEAGTDVVTVDDTKLLDMIKAAAEKVEVNEDGTKTVTVGGVEYKYTAETSEDIILDATNTKDKATIDKIKAALEEAEKNGKQIDTVTIGDVEYKKIVIDGVTYGFHSESNSDTQDVTSDKKIMAALKEAYEKNQGVPNGDGTYSINLDGVRYIYTPGKEEKGVAKEVSFLKNLEGYNMISLGNMKVNQHVNGAIIVCGTLEVSENGDVYVDNNRNADSKKDIGTVSMINKADNNCNVKFVPLSQNVDKDNGKNGHVQGTEISNENAEDKVIGGFVKDITQKTADTIIKDIKEIYNSIIAKFGSNDSYVEDGITFKFINSAEMLSDHINGEGGAAVSGDEKKRDDKISQGYYLTENIVYVVAKEVTDLIVSQLRAIVLAPFTNVSIKGGESAGTVIGANVTNTAQTHTGVLEYEEETKSTPDAAKKETKSTIEKAFETVVKKAKATTNSSTPKASYKKTSYEAASVSAKRNDKKLLTEAWKRKDTEINKVKVSKLFGEKTTYQYGTKTPETPPVTPPPVTPPPTTPPVTPPPTTPPVTPPSITPPTTVTPDIPTEGVLGARRPVSPDAAVLGARRRVLGARRGVLGEKRVLGARTEDTSNAAGAVGVMLGSVALSGVWMTLRRKKKIQ